MRMAGPLGLHGSGSENSLKALREMTNALTGRNQSEALSQSFCFLFFFSMHELLCFLNLFIPQLNSSLIGCQT